MAVLKQLAPEKAALTDRHKLPGADLHYCFKMLYNSSDNCWGPGHAAYTVFKLFSKCHILLGLDLAQARVRFRFPY